MGNYKKLDSADITYIKEIVKDEERVLTGDFINEEYSHDELGGTSSYPDVVVRAKSPEEIAAIMKYAYEHTIPVTPRGAGTGLVGSSVAIEHGIMIDTTLMNHILELDEENLTVTVEPGVLLMELGAYVEEHDFFYPPDPGEKSATIGGNISTNAGGMRAVKYLLLIWTKWIWLFQETVSMIWSYIFITFRKRWISESRVLVMREMVTFMHTF